LASATETVPGSPPATEDTPRSAYAARLAQRQQAAEGLDRRVDHLGLVRLWLVGAGVLLGAAGFFAKQPLLLWPLAPLGAALLILGFRHDALSRQLRRARRAARFYALGLERLDGRWAGQGDEGARYLDEAHPFALDLDLFGHASLFERLCLARTRPGADTLAGWLKGPAGADEVRARQEAVTELSPRLDVREQLALLGAELPPADYAPLISWGTAPRGLPPGRWPLLVNALAAANVITLLGALTLGFGWLPFAASVLLSLAVTRPLRQRVQEVLTPVEAVERDLALLTGLLGLVEREPVKSPELRRLQQALEVEGVPPSQQVARLALLVDWLRAPRNQFFAPIGALLLWRTRMALAFESWRASSGPAIGGWLAALGEVEALTSLAGYAYENPGDPFAEVAEGPVSYEGEGLGHPLLPVGRCVRNDVSLGGEVRLLLVSGSNMSGKSTLLRTVGVNAVLALAGAPVRARRLRLTPLALGATLRVQDSLLEGRSRFFAEVSRVRQLLDLTQGPLPLLFLLDELFHGTNSHDRVVGAAALLRRLLAAGAIGLVTTHDLALAELAGRLGPEARNVHFVDEFREGAMHFDYRLRPGVVPHSNALALMRAVGLEV
jgi:hypothetical protein